MFKVVVGHSEDIDTQDAIDEVLEKCSKSLEGLMPDAAILLAALDYDHRIIIDSIYNKYPEVNLIGCTTEGEISSDLKFVEDSVILMLFCSNEVNFSTGLGKNVSQNPELATKNAVEEAKSKLCDDPKICITTFESLKTSQANILEGLKKQLGDCFPVLGGASAGDFLKQKTFQFFNKEIISDSVPIMLLCGPLKYSFGVSSGWSPIGKTRKATKVDGNIIYDLDGMTPVEFYKHYTGQDAFTLGDHPLAVYDNDDKNFYLRVAFSADDNNGSVSFAGDIPQGATVQIAEVTTERIIDACQESAKRAYDLYPGKKPAALLIFSCAVRKHLLGTRTGKEYESLSGIFSCEMPACGFYTYGEIGPLGSNLPSRMHNATFVTLLLGVD